MAKRLFALTVILILLVWAAAVQAGFITGLAPAAGYCDQAFTGSPGTDVDGAPNILVDGIDGAASTPLPTTALLVGTGILGLALLGFRARGRSCKFSLRGPVSFAWNRDCSRKGEL